MLFWCSDYFNVDRQELKKQMDAEALRQRFVADLGLAQIPIENLVTALKARPDLDRKQLKKLKDWLNNDEPIDNELYRLLPAAIEALAFVTGHQYTENDLEAFKDLIQASED